MKAYIKQQVGVALLELMLVLAIASTFIFITIRVYEQYRDQLTQSQLLANVDQLFQAMTHYYQANCRQQWDIAGNSIYGGKLDPANTSTSSSVAKSINTDLINTGYLTNWHPNNLLVDNSPTEKGYYVQFNPVVQTTNVYACTGPGDPPTCTANPPTRALDGTGTPPRGTSSVIVWRMQVAVKLLDATKQSQYMLQLGASCISTAASANGPVTKCNPAPAQNGYLVWERAATFISGNTSDLWVSQPQLKQFNMQYTNDSMQLLNNDTDHQANYYNSANYVCGE